MLKQAKRILLLEWSRIPKDPGVPTFLVIVKEEDIASVEEREGSFREEN